MSGKIYMLFSVFILITGTINSVIAGVISGKVVDILEEEPVDYAYVILYSTKDSVQVDGTVTNDVGKFKSEGIQPGFS
jgi:hypothetical protein